MKITKDQLKQIIEQEIDAEIGEGLVDKVKSTFGLSKPATIDYKEISDAFDEIPRLPMYAKALLDQSLPEPQRKELAFDAIKKIDYIKTALEQLK